MIGSRRSRRRRPRGRWPRWIIVLAVVLTCAAFGPGLGTPSAAFTSASADRAVAVDVTDDADGLLGLSVAPAVTAGSPGRLVTVTNRVGQTTDVAVSLAGARGTLSNGRETLAPGESVTVAVDVACDDPPTDLVFTVEGAAESRFSAVATRETSVDASDCSRAVPSFASIRIDDTSTRSRGGRAKYSVQYVVDTRTGTFDRVTVEIENRNRAEVETFTSTRQNDVLRFEQPGQRFGDSYVVTVRLFDANGEVREARIELTDTADGDGTVYQAP